MLYFAYGSNLNQAQMKTRCPASRFLGIAFLGGYRFVYDGFSVSWDGAVGNIVVSEADGVWGALYDLTGRDRLALDAFEGYPRSYERREVDVKDREGRLHRAVTYARTGRAIGKPHPDYEKIVLDGARECALPEDYVDRHLRVIRI